MTKFFFFYWPSVLFRKKKTIGHCEAIEIHDFYFRKKKKKNYFAMFLTPIIYLHFKIYNYLYYITYIFDAVRHDSTCGQTGHITLLHLLSPPVGGVSWSITGCFVSGSNSPVFCSSGCESKNTNLQMSPVIVLEVMCFMIGDCWLFSESHRGNNTPSTAFQSTRNARALLSAVMKCLRYLNSSEMLALTLRKMCC